MTMLDLILQQRQLKSWKLKLKLLSPPSIQSTFCPIWLLCISWIPIYKLWRV